MSVTTSILYGTAGWNGVCGLGAVTAALALAFYCGRPKREVLAGPSAERVTVLSALGRIGGHDG